MGEAARKLELDAGLVSVTSLADDLRAMGRVGRISAQLASTFARDGGAVPAALAEDPVWAAMQESTGDEAILTTEQLAELEEGLADVRAGRLVSHEEVLAANERRRVQGE